MYTKRKYGFFMTLDWSKKPLLIGLLYSLAIFLAVYFLPFYFKIPWQPISVIGIAVAFYLGFKNNSSYDRTWEARKIWGSIVNNSRTFGAAVSAFVQGADAPAIKKELLYRHIAWMTALRYQLRRAQPWEHSRTGSKNPTAPEVTENYTTSLESELKNYLPDQEISEIHESANRATQILKIQSERLQELRDKQYFEDFRHMEFHTLITTFYEDQGKSERIKNFPFPRQYASTAFWLCLIFCAFVPFGMLDIIGAHNLLLVGFGSLLSAVIIWVFFLMEMIGDYSENPFEGTYNDVPITSIARTIEIDLRQMINDTDLPGPVQAEKGFLM
ncbi:multidrug transporter [Flavobacteriaceae bacterium TK19130]|nr:multidrug transporter [Thermobacterium salinum]